MNHQIKGRHGDLRGNPLQGKTTGGGEHGLHYEDEEYKVEANKDGDAPISQKSFSNLGGFGRSNVSPLTPNPRALKNTEDSTLCLFSSKGRGLNKKFCIQPS